MKTRTLSSLFILIGALWSLGGAELAWGRVYIVREETTSLKRAQEVLDILTSYEESCDSGCRYTIPALRESRLLEGSVQKGKLLIWQKVVSKKTERIFLTVDIAQKEEGRKIDMVTRYPVSSKIKGLRVRCVRFFFL